MCTCQYQPLYIQVHMCYLSGCRTCMYVCDVYMYILTPTTSSGTLRFKDNHINNHSIVYNCFFAETGQATTPHHDITLHVVLKVGTQVTAGGFPG